MAIMLLNYFGCHSVTPRRELTRVYYYYAGIYPEFAMSIIVEKTDDSYRVTYQKRPMSHPETFDIPAADFKKLSDIVLRMKKQGKETDEENRYVKPFFEVELIEKGNPITRRYEAQYKLDKKSKNLKREAIDLIFDWEDEYSKQFEIRIPYSKGIATPTEIYTHVEPAGLLVDLGGYLERSDPMQEKQPGGTNHYSYRWRAVKPGTVKVWLKELMSDYEADSLSREFEPYGCFEIDEDLKVKRLP